MFPLRSELAMTFTDAIPRSVMSRAVNWEPSAGIVARTIPILCPGASIFAASVTIRLNVIRGLDPRIHRLAKKKHFSSMDRRVKPGDDAVETPGHTNVST